MTRQPSVYIGCITQTSLGGFHFQSNFVFIILSLQNLMVSIFNVYASLLESYFVCTMLRSVTSI